MIKRKKPLKRSTKPIKRGPIRSSGKKKAKRRARYREYMRSPVWKATRTEAIERVGKRCEYLVDGNRCPETRYLQVHHLTYSRFGCEQPEDLQVLCRAHHEYVEATQFSYRRRR